MAVIPFHNLGLVGIIRDQAPHELPPEAWSGGENIRFNENKVVRSPGHEELFVSGLQAPYALMSVPTTVDLYWMMMGLAKVSVYTASHVDITNVGGDYTGDADDIWTGGILNGVPVIHNNKDVPQMWQSPWGATKLVDLTAWPANTTARVIRPFRNFLVALDITLSGVRDPYKIKWSHSADPGTVPDSWDETDPTKDAGETALSETGGFLLDCLPLGDINILYKEDSIYLMQFIGGQFIFRFAKIPVEIGMLAPRCVGQFNRGDGPKHFVITPDDIVVHNAQQGKSILDFKMRKHIFNDLDVDNFQTSYVVANIPEREMWACYPSQGSAFPDIALVYNYITEAITIRPLGLASPHIAAGRIELPTGTEARWDDVEQDVPWDNVVNNIPWGGVRLFAIQQDNLLMADKDDTKTYGIDRTNQFDGVNYLAYIERTGLAIIGQDRQGKPKVDYDARKLITKIWIKASGAPFQVLMGTQESKDSPIEFTTAKTFTPGVDKYLDFHLNTRMYGIRFESQDNAAWEVDSYDLEVELAGRF